jgi:hypothetical protein
MMIGLAPLAWPHPAFFIPALPSFFRPVRPPGPAPNPSAKRRNRFTNPCPRAHPCAHRVRPWPGARWQHILTTLTSHTLTLQVARHRHGEFGTVCPWLPSTVTRHDTSTTRAGTAHLLQGRLSALQYTETAAATDTPHAPRRQHDPVPPQRPGTPDGP